MTWWWIPSLKPSLHPRSSTSLPNLDCTMLEGECWNSKRCQPNTLTSLHLCIDGFSCCYQLMALVGLFTPIIPFLNHMILFSDFPLTSLPSFLYDSLTTQLCIFPFLLYLVMFISHSSDIVPLLSATSELTIYRFYCAQFASHSHGAVRLNRQCQKSKNGWHMSIGESQAYHHHHRALVL